MFINILKINGLFEAVDRTNPIKMIFCALACQAESRHPLVSRPLRWLAGQPRT